MEVVDEHDLNCQRLLVFLYDFFFLLEEAR